jgi:hypothetical protein
MTKIKLKEWADRHNLSYLTANRHFHAGMIPGAVQLDSGTILVEDDDLEQTMAGNTSNGDAMSLFLKKTVEFSKNNSTVEDFAAFIISNFQLQLNSVPNHPKYSRNKPKADEVQKHFQQFLPDKDSVEHLKTVKSLLKEGKIAGDVVPAAAVAATSPADGLLSEEEETIKILFEGTPSIPITDMHAYAGVRIYGEDATEGLVSRSVDFDTTPQQINYTGSTSQTFSSPSIIQANFLTNGINTATVSSLGVPGTTVMFNAPPIAAGATAAFPLTQKELLSAAQVIETAETDELNELPRKRGRKPSKKR